MAKQQGADNLAANQQTAALARPTQIDSNGSQTWALKPGADTKNPQAGDWIVTNKLNDTQQSLKDQQDSLSSQYGDLASGALKTVGDTMATRFDTSQFGNPKYLDMRGQQDYKMPGITSRMGAGPQMQNSGNAFQGQGFASGDIGQAAPEVNKNRAELTREGLQTFGQVDPTTEASRQRITDAMYNRQTAMLDPQSKQQNSDLTSRLATQGITEGSEAYNRSVDNQARQQSAAYQGARDSSILAGGAEDTRIGNQNMDVANLANRNRGQMFGESRDIVGNKNSNIDQIFGQGMQAAQHNTNVEQMNRDNHFSDARFGNDVGNQNFQNSMAKTGFDNAVAGQGFDQEARRLGFNNSADYEGAQFANNLRGMQFNELERGANHSNITRSNSIQEALMKRELGMNEANALRTGNQVGTMGFQAYGGGGQVQGVDSYGAARDTYKAQVDANNVANANSAAAFKGAMSIGTMAMSDRRAKTEIKLIGKHPLGIGWYSWVYTVGDFIGQKWQGVMADELKKVLPEAVVTFSDGFDRVNYLLIGGKDGF